MKEPKRYSCGNGEGMFEDDKNGHWVEYSEHKAIVDALTKQLRKHDLVCAGLNETTTTEIERLIWDILDKYKVNPMQQPNLTIEILKTCDAYLERQQPCT